MTSRPSTTRSPGPPFESRVGFSPAERIVGRIALSGTATDAVRARLFLKVAAGVAVD